MLGRFAGVLMIAGMALPAQAQEALESGKTPAQPDVKH